MTMPWAALCMALLAHAPAGEPVRVGSKKFTESVVLGEVLTQLIDSSGTPAQHLREVGGTRVLWDALRSDQIDLYVEYTGTLREELLQQPAPSTVPQLRAALAPLGIWMSEPLGFEDTYAIGMREDQAAKLGIRTLSELAAHPRLRAGFTHEFLQRADGYPRVRDVYRLSFAKLTGLDHMLAHRALAAGSVDVIDLYSTDPEIQSEHLRVLKDDRHAFPEYAAVVLVRQSALDRHPGLRETIERIQGRIGTADMIAMNARARVERVPESQVAAGFLREALHLEIEAPEDRLGARLLARTREHLVLVGIALLAAVLIAVPLGVLAARLPRLGQFLLGATGVIQTVPALALLVFMIPLLGIGARPAIAALFLYALLPIARNTVEGLRGIPEELQASAEALGLSPRTRLWRIDLPLASRSILAGIQTAAVITVGGATLGALIGAGGYGQPILAGIRLASTPLILEGAIPSAVLALVVQGLFGALGRLLIPKGLRLSEQRR